MSIDESNRLRSCATLASAIGLAKPPAIPPNPPFSAHRVIVSESALRDDLWCNHCRFCVDVKYQAVADCVHGDHIAYPVLVSIDDMRSLVEVRSIKVRSLDTQLSDNKRTAEINW